MEHTCKLEIALADGTPVIYSFPRTRLRADLAGVTKRLQDEFFAIVKGESPDRHGWLTHVAEASS